MQLDRPEAKHEGSKQIDWTELSDVQRTIVQVLEDDEKGIASTQDFVNASPRSETTVKDELKALEDEGIITRRERYKEHIWYFDEDSDVEVGFFTTLQQVLPSKRSSASETAQAIQFSLWLAVLGVILWVLGSLVMVVPLTMLALNWSPPLLSAVRWLVLGWGVALLGVGFMIPAALGVVAEIFRVGIREL